jgi:hypothetical protein
MLFFCSDLSQFTPKVQKFEAFGGFSVVTYPNSRQRFRNLRPLVACKCNLDITVGWEGIYLKKTPITCLV